MEFELIEELLQEDLAEDERDDNGVTAVDGELDEPDDRPLWDWQDSRVGDQAICIPEQEDG